MAYKTMHIRDFRGGENLSVSPDNANDNEVLYAENIAFSQRGGFSPRPGSSDYLTTTLTNPITQYIEFELIDGSSNRITKELVLSNGDLIDLSDESVIRSSLGTWVSWEVVDNKLYILGNGKFFYYDGTTTTDVTSDYDSTQGNLLSEVKNCRLLEQRGDRLFASAHPDHPTNLYYSEPLDPSLWIAPNENANIADGINPIRAVSDDGDIITAIKEFHGALVVFKKRSAFAWFGYDPLQDVTFEQLSVETGTISQDSLVRVNNMLVFLGDHGVYGLTGQFEGVISTVDLSKNIKPRFADMVDVDPFDRPPSAVSFDSHLLIGIPTTNQYENDLILAMNLDIFDLDQSTTCWAEWKGLSFVNLYRSFDDKLKLPSTNSQTILQLHRQSDEVLTDSGDLIYSEIQFSPIDVNKPVHEKKFKRIYLWLKQYDEITSHLEVTTKVDYIEETAEIENIDESGVWDEGSWGVALWGFSDLVTKAHKVNEKGLRLNLKFTNDVAGTFFTFYGVAVEYKLKRPDH